MKKIAILCGLLLLSTNIFAKKPMREGTWTLGSAPDQEIYFIEMDLFDQQFLRVDVAAEVANNEPASPVHLHCTSGDFDIMPGQSATCVVNWSYEVATLTLPKDSKHTVKSMGTYKLTYLS